MRLLFIGDVVGRSGRAAVIQQAPLLRARWKLDFIVINGENAAGGFGLTEAILEEFLAAGVDAVTLGNHAFDQREALVFIERQPRLVRPANYPPGTPGRGATIVESASGARLLVVNLLGRIFMEALDDPFAGLDRELSACPLGEGCHAAVVDVHAEATSEKWALGHYADGRASLVAGTHTHVPSADHRILGRGTGFVTDVGMTGDYDSVIGMEKDEPLRRFTRRIPSGRFEPASGPATLCAVAVEVTSKGLTKAIAPVRIGGLLAPAGPDFWA
jgi:metallophosphoesterase (TIGR00282 family)